MKFKLERETDKWRCLVAVAYIGLELRKEIWTVNLGSQPVVYH